MEITVVTLVEEQMSMSKGNLQSGTGRHGRSWLYIVFETWWPRVMRGVGCKEYSLEAKKFLASTVSGLMAYFVTILTPESARSCVMQCALPIQGMRSIISMVSISPEGFLPSILLLVVIIVTVVIVVVMVILVVVVVAIIGVVIIVTIIGVVGVVVVSSIIKLSFVIIGSLLSIVLCYLIH
ncbi:hypothetical protein Tco_0007198 [Tanacetum coccineum]